MLKYLGQLRRHLPKIPYGPKVTREKEKGNYKATRVEY
jgi:hypothetical protein